MLAVTLAAAWLLARPLNLLGRSERVAAALGENPARLHLFLYFLAPLATAVAVTLTGSVGFVGLVVPHLIKTARRHGHRLLLPLAVLRGRSFLTVADTLARAPWSRPCSFRSGC